MRALRFFSSSRSYAPSLFGSSCIYIRAARFFSFPTHILPLLFRLCFSLSLSLSLWWCCAVRFTARSARRKAENLRICTNERGMDALLNLDPENEYALLVQAHWTPPTSLCTRVCMRKRVLYLPACLRFFSPLLNSLGVLCVSLSLLANSRRYCAICVFAKKFLRPHWGKQLLNYARPCAGLSCARIWISPTYVSCVFA